MDRRKDRTSGDTTAVQLSDLNFCVTAHYTVGQSSLQQQLAFFFFSVIPV